MIVFEDMLESNTGDVLDDMGFPRSSIEITKDMDEDQKVKELYSCFLAQLEIFNERVNE